MIPVTIAIAPIVQEIVLDLPYPPSVNRIWRASSSQSKGRVYTAPGYERWKLHADRLVMTQRGAMRSRISGPFSIEIALCPPKGYPHGDLDNRIKAVLDFLERITVVSSDKFCQRLVAEWVEREAAPEGCRVAVRSWS